MMEFFARRRAVEMRSITCFGCHDCARNLIPDLIIDGKVIADPRVATAFNDSHVAQMLGYLNITGFEVALLLNFKDAKLDWKRVVNERRTIIPAKQFDI